MIDVLTHKIGEKFTLVTDVPIDSKVRVIRSVDGRHYNKVDKLFETFNPLNTSKYDFDLTQLTDSLSKLFVDFIPKTVNDLVFEFRDGSGEYLYSERHTFGGFYDASTPNKCIIYGTVLTPSGTPCNNVKVEALLNKSGYFIDKHPLLGPVAGTYTNEIGYFELPLIQGISVTINIPSSNFTTSGFVPNVPSLELSPYCLLKTTTTVK